MSGAFHRVRDRRRAATLGIALSRPPRADRSRQTIFLRGPESAQPGRGRRGSARGSRGRPRHACRRAAHPREAGWPRDPGRPRQPVEPTPPVASSPTTEPGMGSVPDWRGTLPSEDLREPPPGLPPAPRRRPRARPGHPGGAPPESPADPDRTRTAGHPQRNPRPGTSRPASPCRVRGDPPRGYATEPSPRLREESQTSPAICGRLREGRRAVSDRWVRQWRTACPEPHLRWVENHPTSCASISRTVSCMHNAVRLSLLLAKVNTWNFLGNFKLDDQAVEG